MKKFLKYSGLLSLVLGALAFILMLATPAVVVKSGSSAVNFSGGLVIFGGELDLAQAAVLIATEAKPSVLALLAWILSLAALVIVLLGVLLPLLKVKAIDKFAGVLNLVAVCAFAVAGVFMFITVPSFFGANGFDKPLDKAGLGAGWVIAAILFIVAAAVAICPAVADFLGKKKKK